MGNVPPATSAAQGGAGTVYISPGTVGKSASAAPGIDSTVGPPTIGMLPVRTSAPLEGSTLGESPVVVTSAVAAGITILRFVLSASLCIINAAVPTGMSCRVNARLGSDPDINSEPVRGDDNPATDGAALIKRVAPVTGVIEMLGIVMTGRLPPNSKLPLLGVAVPTNNAGAAVASDSAPA